MGQRVMTMVDAIEEPASYAAARLFVQLQDRAEAFAWQLENNISADSWFWSSVEALWEYQVGMTLEQRMRFIYELAQTAQRLFGG
jgi:hypothetical protein